MKFKCFCGNVINATDGFCKGVCTLHNESEYLQWVKYFSDITNDHPHSERAFFCEECKRYSVYYGGDLYVFKPCPVEMTLPDNYEAYHLTDEYEQEDVAVFYDDPQNRNEAIKADFDPLFKTRMMNISFAEKKAFIENLDGSIEAYVIDREIIRSHVR